MRRNLNISVVLVFLLFLGSLILVSNARTQESEPQYDGSPLEYMMTISAHIICSGVFVAGRDANHIIENDLMPFGFFDFNIMDISIDYEEGIVSIDTDGEPGRTVVYNGSQGCTILPLGENNVFFDPIEINPNLPDPSTQNWPTGDVTGEIPSNVDAAAIESILDNVFQDPGERAWVIVYDGKIIGERYKEGFNQYTRHRSWSMGKSVTSALFGILVKDGHHNPKDPAPIPEWQQPGDPRSNITIEHLLQMSGGLDFDDIPMGHPDYFTPKNHHNFVYFEGINIFDWSINRDLLLEPGTVYRYRNCDPLSVGRIIRDTVEEHYDMDYLEFPQRALYDKIGVRGMTHEVDPYGNFILTGANWGTARDWARFGLLHLQDGVWEGERILPEGWVNYITTPSVANPGYGCLFHLNLSSIIPLGAYWASGAFGQQTMIIPSENLVIAKLAWLPRTNFNAVVRQIIDSIGPKPITIAVKPGSYPNPINLKSKGVIPVAILTTPDFDATIANPESVRFGPAEATPVKYAFEDVNEDGNPDMVLHFRTKETGLCAGDTIAELTGRSLTGWAFLGVDSIVTVP